MTARCALALAAALAVTLSGCGLGGRGATRAHTDIVQRAVEAVTVVPEPIRLAVVGDSITSWSPPYAGKPAQSWVFTATSNDLPLVGGWARPGVTIGTMLANLTPVEDVDVLVLMVGTNDVFQGTDVTQRLAGIDTMVAMIDADEVLVSSTAPFGYDYALGAAWNVTLAAHAYARGWHYADPWADLRQPDGSWAPGADYGDRIHPSPASAAHVGGELRDVILDVARGTEGGGWV